MGIAFIDLAAQQNRIREKLDARIAAVLDHGKYIMGPEVAEFEAELSNFCGVKHSLGCGNGTDALLLALMALGVTKGDAVFCPSFTFAATAEVVPSLGAVPVFVDVDSETFNICPDSLLRAIEQAKTLGLKPKAIIPVDLFGLPANYPAIKKIARQEGLQILVDSAQGFGGTIDGKTTVGMGDIATTSFFPAKPLGCYGDGGAVFTNDDEHADLVKSLRVHGKGSDKYDNVRIGMNSRLDTMQAAILLEKMAVYQDEIERRQVIADRYIERLKDVIKVPHVPDGYKSVWAQFTLQARDTAHRDSLMGGLKDAGVPSVVYYPMPLHKQTAYAEFPADPKGMVVSDALAQQVFSLPMHPYMKEDDQEQIIQVLANLCGKN